MPKKAGMKLDDRSVANLKASVKECNDIVSRLKKADIAKKDARRTRKSPAGMDRGAKRCLLRDNCDRAGNAAVEKDVDRLINLSHQAYNQYRPMTGAEPNTHEFITDKAMALLGMDPGIADVIHRYCTYPDEPKSDMSDLIFEGHFYGKTASGEPGNFLVNQFSEPVLAFMEERKKALYGDDEDIQEHAVMNFKRYYDQAMRAGSDDQKLFYLGVAAHFLEDLTAPHHTGNYPAFPYVDHVFFEKFASHYVYDKPAFKISRVSYNDFKNKLKSNPKKPEAYALEITSMATPYIQYIRKVEAPKSKGAVRGIFSMDAVIDKLNETLLAGKHEPWEKAIVGAVPLAVYATAYLLETTVM